MTITVPSCEDHMSQWAQLQHAGKLSAAAWRHAASPPCNPRKHKMDQHVNWPSSRLVPWNVPFLRETSVTLQANQLQAAYKLSTGPRHEDG